ncbi:hypothetical protein [Clostridium sp.]
MISKQGQNINREQQRENLGLFTLSVMCIGLLIKLALFINW